MRLPGPFMRWGRGLACALGGAALATAAQAQFGASVALDSDYRYRGVSLSDSKPSLRLTLNYDAAERWYAGASAARAALTSRDSYMQILGYAGWTMQPVDGRSLEIGVDASHFVGIQGYDFAEAYAGLLAERWSARVYYAPHYYGRHVPVIYTELSAHVPVGRLARLFAHIGALVPREAGHSDAARTRIDIGAGMGLVLRNWDLHLAAVAASRGGPYPAVYSGRRTAVVAGASYSF